MKETGSQKPEVDLRKVLRVKSNGSGSMEVQMGVGVDS